jgi:hypothetical protein|tara:strand:- start:328 stop:606 length:279 start_codon:yes stop_codon:yes gene_type:complete
MKKIIYMFFAIFLFIGCSSSDESVLENKIGKCEKEVEVIKAYGDDIRIRYPLGKESEADELAKEWCDVNGKVSVKGTISCQGCCYSSYVCKQ